MKLTIGFSKPKHLKFPIFSWLIRAWEGVGYSHVFLRWYSPSYGKYLVYHAAGSGLHFLGEEQAKRQLDVVVEYELDITPSLKHRIVSYCLQKAGTPYGLWNVVGIALKRLLRLSKNPLADGEDTQFCSEFVSRVLVEHFDVELPKSPDSMGLVDLEQLLIEITQ